MRKGDLGQDTTALLREAVESLNSSGRKFDEKERAALKDKIEKTPAPEAEGPAPPRAEEPARKEAEGRVRSNLSEKAQDLKSVQSRPGELQEDSLRRLIEQGQAKVAPEYRKPVEDYYKAVSK